MPEDRFRTECEGLVRAWGRYGRGHLRDYLVQGVEDPRINIQSILTRHFLIEQLFGSRFEAVAEAELHFAIVMNWLMKVVSESRRAEHLSDVLDALMDGSGAAGCAPIPSYVRRDFDRLPREIGGSEIGNYISEVLMWAPVEAVALPLPESAMNTFATVWGRLLAGERCGRVSVIEPACGSANDYRFIDAYGIARHVDYHGFDLCGKNIDNARQMFGDISFAWGNALAIHRANKSFDCCFVHDLLEHLSIAAGELALEEILRVTRRACCLGLFNTGGDGEHVERRVDDYYWNTLSLSRIEAFLAARGWAAQIVHVDTLLRGRFQCGDTHNRGACTVVATIKT
ncbi:MAG: class I SAM-dependent methyltransferase [Phycisphaerae bacterium]|nr:class I SAM-dependent methyltransferase [Phycisphaerae bacterium]